MSGPAPGTNLVERVLCHASGEQVAIVSEAERVTYRELARRVELAAEKLTARVGLLCADGTDYIVLSLAVLAAGGCVVPVATELVVEERDALARLVALDAVVAA